MQAEGQLKHLAWSPPLRSLSSQALKHQSVVSEYSSSKVAELPVLLTPDQIQLKLGRESHGEKTKEPRALRGLFHSCVTHGHHATYLCSYLSGNKTAFHICLATLVSRAGRKAACIPQPPRNQHLTTISFPNKLKQQV